MPVICVMVSVNEPTMQIAFTHPETRLRSPPAKMQKGTECTSVMFCAALGDDGGDSEVGSAEGCCCAEEGL